VDLLTNAVEAIRLGIDDYQAGSRPRLFSAVRNIHAGILLLYKEALLRLSPAGSNEVLLKVRILPKLAINGQIEFVGDGNKTVDVQQIKERFKALGITTDWSRFDAITRVRNEIEHYYTSVTKRALQGLIANAFVIIRGFITQELGDDPRELLGETAWRTMLGVAEVYAEERAECDKALFQIKWRSAVLEAGIAELRCRECGSDLLCPVDSETSVEDLVLRCRSCGVERSSTESIPEAVRTALSMPMYLVYDDGADLPYVPCPQCGADAYIIEEQRCALCGHEAEHTCSRCGNDIPPEELDSSPYCGWCAHMMSKDD
jgi:hypothetical protein